MMRNTKRIPDGLAAGLAIMLLLACGACEDDNTEIVVPDGSGAELKVDLAVQVLAWPSGQPVAAATWEVVQEDLSGTADGEGYFTVADLALGSHQIRVSAPDHYTTRYNVTVDPDLAKQSWRMSGTVHLPEPAASYQVMVVDRDQGMPVAGAPIVLTGFVFPGDRTDLQLDAGQMAAVGVSDSLGMAFLDGLPAGTVTLRIGGQDQDQDGFPDYAIRSLTVETATDHVGTGTAILTRPGETLDSIDVLATNLPATGGAVTAESVYFIYNMPMYTEPSSLTATLRRYSSPYTEVPLLLRWTSPLRLELEPVGELLGFNVLYQLDLFATSTNGLVHNVSRRFYWLQPADVGGETCDEIVGSLELHNAAPIDFDTAVLELSWSPTACGRGYDIYLRDDRFNSDWLYYAHEETDYETGLVEHTVALPSVFDRYRADSVQTPFAGTEVSVCVVPTGAVVNVPGEPHATLALRDVTPPALTAVYLDGMINNTTAQEMIVTLEVLFSEYLDPASTAPTLEFREAGGDPGYCPDPSSAVWRWRAGMMSGYFEFVLPPGADGTEDEYRVMSESATDLAGNIRTEGLDSGWVIALPTGGYWDFEQDDGGWTRTGGVWEWGAPSDGPASGYQSSRCWATGLHAFYPNNVDVRLVSPQIIVPARSPHIEFYAYDDFDAADFWELIIEVDGVETPLNHVTNDSDYWRLVGFTLNEFAGQPARIIFRFWSGASTNDSGLFIDNVHLFSDE